MGEEVGNLWIIVVRVCEPVFRNRNLPDSYTWPLKKKKHKKKQKKKKQQKKTKKKKKTTTKKTNKQTKTNKNTKRNPTKNKKQNKKKQQQPPPPPKKKQQTNKQTFIYLIVWNVDLFTYLIYIRTMHIESTLRCLHACLQIKNATVFHKLNAIYRSSCTL